MSNMMLGRDAYGAPMNLGGTYGTGIGSTEGQNDWESYRGATADRARHAAMIEREGVLRGGMTREQQRAADAQARRDAVANNVANKANAVKRAAGVNVAQQTAMQDPVAMNQWGDIDFSQYAPPNVVVPDDFNFDVSAYGGFEGPPAPAPSNALYSGWQDTW
jgi:hypothetical protein